jgi:hypothetical protein
MDVVYTCRPGKNEELRYSIRSVQKNASFVRDVWVVGDKPDWYSGKFLDVAQTSNAFQNVRTNLKTIIDNFDISEDFVFMNDDFFIVKKIDSVPTYYNGLLSDRSRRHTELAGMNYYANFLMRSDQALRRYGIKEPLNYELHVPIVFNKTMLLETIDKQFSIRSCYGNIHNIGGKEIRDVKIYTNPRFAEDSSSIDNDTPFVSTDDESFRKMGDIIKDMFPDRSSYEND